MLKYCVALLPLLLAASVAHAQDTACTVNSGAFVGSPACPYQWVGATTVLFDGSGNGLGFVGMTSQCRGEFGPGARMCTSVEVMQSDTLNLNDVPAPGCWMRPVFSPLGSSPHLLDAGGAQASAGDGNLSCLGWRGTVGLGLTLTQDGALHPQICGEVRSVACCAPTPVPSPTSSLSLPVGAAGLAGLYLLKGGVL